MKTNFTTLAATVSQLHKDAELQEDRLSNATTLSKMSQEQIDDLSSMIIYFLASGDEGQKEPGYILANVMHDLNGLKAGFLDLPAGKGFLPRSDGYSKRTKRR